MGLLDNQNQGTYYGAGNAANYGNYQFTTLDNIITGFMVGYVGEHKIINKINRTDVQFHAMRAIQELSYDVFRSVKSQEIEVPNTLTMILPQDYVNYVKLTTVGSDGIEKNIYPTGKTSNPFAISQDNNGTYQFEDRRVITVTPPSTGSAQVEDGDYLELFFPSTIGTPMGTIGIGDYKCYFVFDKDDDPDDAAEPSSEELGPRFIITLGATTYTQQGISNLLANSINSFGHHTAVVNGDNSITITYNEHLTWANTTYETILPLNTGNTEGMYTASTQDGSGNGTNFTITLTNHGGGDNTLSEQTPSNTWSDYQSTNNITESVDATDSTDAQIDHRGRRYGLDPQYAHQHGSFYIDYSRGLINFSSNLSGSTIILKYISDGLGTDAEMVVHKFCEEAVYKWILCGVLSARSNVPEYIIARFKKEKFAETRKAKIRLSNIKIEEFTQVLKGMSKQIK